LIYITGILLAVFGLPLIATLFNAVVALIWPVPDRRIERALAAHGASEV
jgi:hypothetical protein